MKRVQNNLGRYDYLTGIPAFPSGVRARDGYEIARVVFARPAPWPDGFDRVERRLTVEHAAPAALCSVELRCTRPYSPDEPTRPEFSLKRAADYIEQANVAWWMKPKCVACHTSGTYLLIRPALTPQLGPPSADIRGFYIGAFKK